jgi:hypothetical protein
MGALFVWHGLVCWLCDGELPSKGGDGVMCEKNRVGASRFSFHSFPTHEKRGCEN